MRTYGYANLLHGSYVQEKRPSTDSPNPSGSQKQSLTLFFRQRGDSKHIAPPRTSGIITLCIVGSTKKVLDAAVFAVMVVGLDYFWVGWLMDAYGPCGDNGREHLQ